MQIIGLGGISKSRFGLADNLHVCQMFNDFISAFKFEALIRKILIIFLINA